VRLHRPCGARMTIIAMVASRMTVRENQGFICYVSALESRSDYIGAKIFCIAGSFGFT
jgi:hypothetical protein